MPVQAPRPAPQYGTPFEVTTVRPIEPYWVEMFDGGGEKKVLLVLCGRGQDTRLRFLDLTGVPLAKSLRPASAKLYEALRGYIPGLTEIETFEGDNQLPDALADKVMSVSPVAGGQ